MGATGGLSPVVSIGFNKDVAWTHTVSTGRRFTLYELKLDPADPTVYLVDGQRRKMSARTIVLPAAAAPGGAPAQKTFYSTEWGPVISMPRAGLDWTATKAYAIRDVNTLNTRSAQSWMQMALARNVAELRTAMGNQGMPWINTTRRRPRRQRDVRRPVGGARRLGRAAQVVRPVAGRRGAARRRRPAGARRLALGLRLEPRRRGRPARHDSAGADAGGRHVRAGSRTATTASGSATRASRRRPASRRWSASPAPRSACAPAAASWRSKAGSPAATACPATRWAATNCAA